MTQLATAPFGATGMEITRVGFGAWAIGGGDWEFGWGPQQDDESVTAITHAIESGVNWIDTAAGYGFGRSERIVGKAIAGLRDKPYVFTKCSLLEGPDRKVVHSLKRDSILREAEASLERLGVDAIDLYYQHRINPEVPIEEFARAVQRLIQAGKVKHYGMSEAAPAMARPRQSSPPARGLERI